MKTKLTFTFFFLFFSVLAFGQKYSYGNYVDVTNDECTSFEVLNPKPAPCSIERNTKMVPIYVIRIGVYRRMINTDLDTFMQILSDSQGNIYTYYLNIQFHSQQDAKNYLNNVILSQGIYCDAIVERDPSGRYGFVNF